MPSNYTVNLPNDTLLDAGALFVGVTCVGATRGGLNFDPGAEVTNVDYDGKRTDQAGFDRVTGYNPVISGKLLTFGTGSISQLMPNGISAFGSGTGSYTVATGSTYFPAASYLNAVKLVFSRGGGGFAAVCFPQAICETWKLSGTDKKEGELDISIAARLHPTSSVPDAAPYYVALHNTLASVLAL